MKAGTDGLAQAVLTREGEYWTLSAGESVVRLRDSKGLRYLAVLAERPGEDVHALDLVATVEGVEARQDLGDAGELLDPAAKEAYRRRYQELQEELDEAESFNDPERAAAARGEMEAIAGELASAVGLGGRDRKAASAAERARVNVTRAIRSVARKVAEHDEALGRQLESSVKTGSFCSYLAAPELKLTVGAAGVAARTQPPPPAAHGRAVRALVFTDVVGSTHHIARLGDAGWRELLRRHDELVQEWVHTFYGQVVTQSGDGVFMAFDAPGNAIRCAEALCQAVQSLGIELRAGVHTGECELLGDTVVGMAVHIASRVSSLAGPGEVLVSSTTRDLVAGSDIELAERGAHELRGVPGQWHVYAVRGDAGPEAPPEAAPERPPAPATPAEVPLPSRLAAARKQDLIGRARELSQLSLALECARAGDRQAVLLAGEPGIGKTRLAAEAAERARAQDAIVLYGRSDEELGVPYQPFVEALGHYVAHAPRPVLERHRSDHGDALARLLPELAGGREVETSRYVLFSAVAGLLAAAAAEGPLVLVVDDLHAADKPTLLLLRYLLTSPLRMGLVVVGIYRSTDFSRDHPLAALLADLRGEPGLERIELGGLERGDVADLTRLIAGGRLRQEADEFAGRLRKETGGNPFFVTEILRHLDESGGADLPGSVRETIARRVQRLGERAETVLTAAAVIGRDFDVNLLAAVLEEDEDRLLDVLDLAAGAALIGEAPGPGSRYGFAHGLIPQTLYEDLSGGRRQRLHRRVAEALERLDLGDARLGELAHHALRGTGPTEAAKAIDYARRAGERALAQLAPDEAVRWYSEALELHERHPAGGDELRCELLIGLGTAQRDSGDSDFRATLLDASDLARRLDDSERLVRAALANTRGFVSATGLVDSERVEALEAALAAVGSEYSHERAMLLAMLAAELTFSGEWERRLRLSDEALTVARRLDSPGTLSDVLSARFMAIWTPATLAERVANTDEELAAAESANDALGRFRALHWRAASAVEGGDLAGAAELIEREARLAAQLRQPTARWLAAYDRATLALMRGLLQEAEVWAEEAGQIGSDSGQPEALAFYGGQLVNIRYEQGRLAELEPLIASEVEDNPGIPAFRAALVLARCEAGRLDDARAMLTADAEGGFADFPYDSNWLVGLVIYAEATAKLGHAGAAEPLRRLLEPFEGQVAFNSATAWGAVGRQLGNLDAVLVDHERGEQRLRHAAELHERAGAPIWLARTRLDLARLLLSGDRAASSETGALLDQALATAQDLGCAGIEREASELLGEVVGP